MTRASQIQGYIYSARDDRLVIQHRHTFVHVFLTGNIPQELRNSYVARVGQPVSIWAKKNDADQFVLMPPTRYVPISLPYEDRRRA